MAKDRSRFDGERAFARLLQLAKEQREAASRGDTRLLCRIAALIPSTVAAIDPADIRQMDGIHEALADVQAANTQSIRVLEQRKDEIRERMRGIVAARRALSGYGSQKSITAPRRVDTRE